jgi:hypothetical protein
VWRDTAFIELSNFRNRSILAGNLDAENPARNSQASNLSCLKLLDFFISSNCTIMAPQCPTHFLPDGRNNVLYILAHQNVQLSEVTVPDILDSDHLLIMFSILDPGKFWFQLKNSQTESGFKAWPPI